MTVERDSSPAFADFAHPERLVSTEWLAEHLGEPGLVVVESDEDVLLYETGHIAGAVKIDWHTDLNDPVTRDYLDGAGFAALLGSKGISRDSTVVIYGDKNNWWAAYALWVFTLFGHDDVRLLDGGRAKWEAEGREYTTDVPTPDAVRLPGRRARRLEDPGLQRRRDRPLRQPARRRALPRGVRRRSHHRACLPRRERPARRPHPERGERAVGAGGRRRRHLQAARSSSNAIYRDEVGLKDGDSVIAYCRIGERSSHTWFVLTHLLGFEGVRNYDGSWTEWGSAVRVPIVKGASRAPFPRRRAGRA